MVPLFLRRHQSLNWRGRLSEIFLEIHVIVLISFISLSFSTILIIGIMHAKRQNSKGE